MLTNFHAKYRVQCKIGEGSFSEVLRCQNRESGQLIAAKRLKKSFLSPHDAAEIPEVIAMRKLPQHPNILHLVEAHYEAPIGKVTLIFDLMDMSIYDMMRNRKRPLPESRVKNYLYQILKGVTHLHNHGIFHRDIKPENILIKGEQIKIADLGSVRGIYSRKPYTEYISTRWYRSPECLLTSGYYGPKMDVWAIGCVFYELLTLKPLFPGSNEVDQIAKIHTVLGTPNQELISRFRRHKSQLMDINFPQKSGTGFGPLLQNLSENGRDILKIMLTYDPKIRSATRRLIENRYFNDLRESDLLRKRVSASSTSSASSNPEWRNPVLLSFMTSERKRKQKQINVLQSKVPRPIQSMPFKTTRLKTPIPRLLKDPGRTTMNHPKPAANKILNKTGTKPKIIQRQVQNIQQMPQKPIHVLQETTNILPTPRKIPIPSTGSASLPNSQVRINYNTTSASFLPSLSVKQNVPLLRSIPHKHRSFPHGVVSSRHFIPKSFLNSANKPRLAPILEHVHLDNGLA